MKKTVEEKAEELFLMMMAVRWIANDTPLRKWEEATEEEREHYRAIARTVVG